MNQKPFTQEFARTVDELQAELQRCKRALDKLAREAQMWLRCSRCPNYLVRQCKPDIGCATTIKIWALSEAEKETGQ